MVIADEMEAPTIEKWLNSVRVVIQEKFESICTINVEPRNEMCMRFGRVLMQWTMENGYDIVAQKLD